MHSDVSKWEFFFNILLIQNGGAHIFLREEGGGAGFCEEKEKRKCMIKGMAWM